MTNDCELCGNDNTARVRTDSGTYWLCAECARLIGVDDAGNEAGRSRALDVAVSARPAPLNPSDR